MIPLVVTVIVAVVLAATGSVAWLRRRLRIVTVEGDSMRPTLAPGARLLVRRVPLSRVRTGDIVVLASMAPAEAKLAADAATFADFPVADEVVADEMVAEVPIDEAITFEEDGEVSEHHTGGANWLIKRAVATPGDPVPASVVSVVGATPGAPVPGDVLVVLGDNRDSSFDSRAFGYVPADKLLGVVVRPMRGGRTTRGHDAGNREEKQWSTS